MVEINEMQKTVLMYLESALDTKPEGMKASEMAETIGEPVADIVAVCEQLEQMEMLRVEHRIMAADKVKDMKLHILEDGISALFKAESKDAPN